jgi:hypothetical protein
MQPSRRRIVALAAAFAAGAHVASAVAGDVTGDTCAQYVAAYKEGAAGYDPYLKVAATMAQSRDALAGGIRSTLALRGEKPDATAKALDAWCSEHQDKKLFEAVSRHLDRLIGVESPAVMAEPAPSAMPAPGPLRKPEAAQPPSVAK